MPNATYRGVIAIAFARLTNIPSGPILEGDPSPEGVLTGSGGIATANISAPGNGNLVGPQTFYHFFAGNWNKYTIVNDSGSPRNMTSNATGLIMNGRLVTMGMSGASIFVNDTALRTIFSNSAFTLTDLPIATAITSSFSDVVDSGESMIVTLFPGDTGSFGWNFPDFSNGQNVLVVYSPSLASAYALAPGFKVQLGATHDNPVYNAVDIANGVNYTYCGGNRLQVWSYDRATNAVVFSKYNEPITLSAPGGGITGVQKATPYGFMFNDATLGMCFADMAWENYWSLSFSGLPGRVYQMTMDPEGLLYVSDGVGYVYASPTPYYSVVGGGGGGGWTGIPAGGAPAAGTGVDPHIVLQISNDGGRTWGSERAASTGRIGQFRKRVQWRRLGRSADRAYRVIDSEPVQKALISVDLDSDAE